MRVYRKQDEVQTVSEVQGGEFVFSKKIVTNDDWVKFREEVSKKLGDALYLESRAEEGSPERKEAHEYASALYWVWNKIRETERKEEKML